MRCSARAMESLPPVIAWGPQFETGFSAIDAEHQALAEILNGLPVAEAEGRRAVVALLKQLAEHIAVHFAHEEKLMARLDYPRRGIHWSEHDELLKDMTEVITEVEVGRMTNDGGALEHYLKFWLLTHILTEDCKLAAFLLDRQRNGMAL